MIENLYSILIVVLYAILYGITMKIADLFNEHEMKPPFKGVNILFGFLWGVFGVLLILFDNNLANIVIAMIIAFILRFRIDYLNHGIATSMMLIVFLLKSKFELNIFLPFFLAFAMLGLIEDFISGKLERKMKIPKRIPFYSLVGITYSVITGNWIIFLWAFSYELAYIITDIWGTKTIKRQKGYES